METRKPNVVYHGPVAEHDMACPVFFSQYPAVLDMHRGVFEPSWQAQAKGWRLVQARTWFQRLALRIAFTSEASHP